MEEKQAENVQKQKLICGKSSHLSGGKCILEVCMAEVYCAVSLNCVTVVLTSFLILSKY